MDMERLDIHNAGWIQHAYEECLDAAIYLKRAKMDIEMLMCEVYMYRQQEQERLNSITHAQEQIGKYIDRYGV
jgi:hypothetical protein